MIGGAAGSPGSWCSMIFRKISRTSRLMFCTCGEVAGYILAMSRKILTASKILPDAAFIAGEGFGEAGDATGGLVGAGAEAPGVGGGVNAIEGVAIDLMHLNFLVRLLSSFFEIP